MEVVQTEMQMSPLQTKLVARALIDPIRAFYEVPENEAKFREWQKKRKGGERGDETERGSHAERVATEGTCKRNRNGRADDE